MLGPEAAYHISTHIAFTKAKIHVFNLPERQIPFVYVDRKERENMQALDFSATFYHQIYFCSFCSTHRILSSPYPKKKIPHSTLPLHSAEKPEILDVLFHHLLYWLSALPATPH